MDRSESVGGQREEPKERRLDSWKEIASYLRREVRTLHYWEQREGLPVRRHMHEKLGSVYAYKTELDTWQSTRLRVKRQSSYGEPVRETSRGIRASDPNRAGNTKLAILPFRNIDFSGDEKYLSRGLTEDIVTELSRLNLRALGIVLLDDFDNRLTNRSGPEVFQELGAEYVLKGSLRRSGNRVRVTVRLIHGCSGSLLWSEQYDLDLVEMMNGGLIEVARGIARSSSLSLLSLHQPSSHKVTLTSQCAYEAYVNARNLWSRRTEQCTKIGIFCFRRAIQRDPSFAQAYSGLAGAYMTMNYYGIADSAQVMPRAKSAVMKAIRIDPRLAEGHAFLADIRLQCDWDWVGAETEYQLAIELDPTYATAHHWYARYLSVTGRREEARAEIQQAEQLDPSSSIVGVWDGIIWYYARQYDKAIKRYRQVIELDPNYGWAHAYLGLAYAHSGLLEQAIEAFNKGLTLSGRNTCITAMLGHAYAISGNKEAALDILEELRLISRKRYVPSVDIAAIFAGLKKDAQAFEWLNKACSEGDSRIVDVKVEPRFDNLRGGRRFDHLLHRIGLAS
jgi:TolB-like protein/tetratricopeptide (TPR) repeat protein